MDAEGNVRFGTAFVDDITERKLVEEELRISIIDLKESVKAGHVGLWNWNLITNEVNYSAEWKNQIGYKEHEISNDFSEWEDRVHPEDLKATIKIIEKAIKDVNQKYRSEFRFRHKDGSYRWIVAQASFVLNEKGHPIRMVGSHLDITDLKQAEIEKIKIESQLQQAQKMESIGTLAGGIAHDFNNILSAIIGFSELALNGVDKGTELEDDLKEVHNAGMRAKDLVRQILTFARQSDEEIKPIQLNIIAKEVLKFIRSTIPTNIQIEDEIVSDSFIMGSPTHIHQILMNLCTNSSQAMEEKGGILKVSLNDVIIDKMAMGENLGLLNGDYIEVKVSDTGIGIPSRNIQTIFEPYFTTKKIGEGTGMGLAVVHGIVESCGGKITVESTMGKGTVFTIYLPISKKRIKYDSFEEEALPIGKEQILFVDDEAPISKMGSRMLEQLGYTVTSRTSSVEALELFRSKPKEFDLVITDMTMPNITGDKLAVELMKIRHDIPVVLCTGYSKRMSEKSASEIGIKAIVYKPTIKSDMAKTVRKVLDESKISSEGKCVLKI